MANDERPKYFPYPDRGEYFLHPKQQIDAILTQHEAKLHNQSVRDVYEALKWYAELLNYSLEVQVTNAHKTTDDQRSKLSIMQPITEIQYVIDNLLAALENAHHSLSFEIAGNDMGYERRRLGELEHAVRVLAELWNRVHSRSLVAGDVSWNDFLIINRAVELLIPLNN